MKQQATTIASRIWDIRAALEAEGVEIHPRRNGKEIHPDLARFRDYWYVGFKDLSDCAARIIRSADGLHWETATTALHSGVYKGYGGERRLSITAAGELMVNCVTDVVGGGRASLTWLSTDGEQWDGPFDDLGENTYRFDVTWYNGKGYSLAYWGKDAAGTLYVTEDGRRWQVAAREVFPEAHRAGYEEASLAFDPSDGMVHAIVRANNVYAIIGQSEAPYTRWRWRNARTVVGEGERYRREGKGAASVYVEIQQPEPEPAPQRLGPQLCGPKLMRLSDGRFLVAGVSDATSAYEVRPQSLGRIDLFELDPHTAVLTRLARLDGFSNYPGLVEHEGKVWVSCGRWVGERPQICLVVVDL